MENMFINLNKTLRSATLKIFIAALASTLAFSESTIKSIINDWMSECKVIVQIEKPERMNNSEYNVPLQLSVIGSSSLPLYNVPLQLYVIGSSSLPLHLKLKTRNSSTIEGISFVGEIDKNQNNLLLHPLAGLECYGTDDTYSKFCRKSESDNTYNVHLNELSSNYIYSFAVYILSDKTELKNEDLIVYSHPSDEINNKVRCKLEGSTWLNYYARQDTTFRLISLGVFLFVITLMLAAARKISKNEP